MPRAARPNSRDGRRIKNIDIPQKRYTFAMFEPPPAGTGLKGNPVRCRNSTRCCEFRPVGGTAVHDATDPSVGKAHAVEQVRRPARTQDCAPRVSGRIERSRRRCRRRPPRAVAAPDASRRGDGRAGALRRTGRARMPPRTPLHIRPPTQPPAAITARSFLCPAAAFPQSRTKKNISP